MIKMITEIEKGNKVQLFFTKMGRMTTLPPQLLISWLQMLCKISSDKIFIRFYRFFGAERGAMFGDSLTRSAS